MYYELPGEFHLTQHTADLPTAALRLHIAALPYDDGAGPFDEELEWLKAICSGMLDVQLLPVAHCKNTWLWIEGARYNPKYITNIVQTEPEADAREFLGRGLANADPGNTRPMRSSIESLGKR